MFLIECNYRGGLSDVEDLLIRMFFDDVENLHLAFDGWRGNEKQYYKE